jgi:glycerol-3-phosphate dehydrogenase (NAD(P)+)
LLCRNGHGVRLWGHDPGQIAQLCADDENRQYLPGVPLPTGLTPVADLAAALDGASAVLVVVPSHAFSDLLVRIRDMLPPGLGVAWATKGFEPGSGRLLHKVAAQTLPGRDLAVVSGPTFAREVAQGLPTAVTVASPRPAYAQRLADLLHGERFRAYVSDDIVGVQVGGGAKNVLAIAAGIADGLGFGANTRAAIITRGLAELIRLGTALGGKRETFMGLAGLGDLVLTCTDNQSRNRRVGLALARGIGLDAAKAEIGQEVEGVITARTVRAMAQALNVEMPISEQVYAVLYEGVSPAQATAALLERRSKAEFY